MALAGITSCWEASREFVPSIDIPARIDNHPSTNVSLRRAAAEIPQIRSQFIADASKDCQSLFVRADLRRGRVFEAMVELFTAAKEYRAGFAGVVAHGDNVIESLALEFINVL